MRKRLHVHEYTFAMVLIYFNVFILKDNNNSIKKTNGSYPE